MAYLAMLGAALFFDKAADSLALGTDSLVQLVGCFDGDHSIVLTVQHQEWTFDPVRHVFQGEFLRPLQRCRIIGSTDDPAELKCRA
jgi:hypothetical protein